ncbi:MAG: contractile injection system protein, VgrG/Pvc8 family [Litorimonas sp.]
MTRAVWRIGVDGVDITARLRPHFVSLELSDSRGHEADDLTMQFADPKGDLDLPAAGTSLRFHLGVEGPDGRTLFDKGLFHIDEIGHSGPPDRLEIKAAAADFTQGLKVRRDASWSEATIGQIVGEVAARHGLARAIDDRFADYGIDHVTQSNESDMNLLSRLAREHGGFFTVKNGFVIFSSEAEGKTPSGRPLPPAALDRGQTSSYRFTQTSREPKFSGVRAAWNDMGKGEKSWVEVGDGNRVKRLQGVFPTQDKARAAAAAEYRRLSRAVVAFQADLSSGRPDIIPETPLRLSGFVQAAQPIDWIVNAAAHSVDSGGGITTRIDAEARSETDDP